MKQLTIILLFLFSALVSHSQTKLDSINSMIEEMIAEHRLVSVLLGIESLEMPIGIVRTIGNVQYAMAVSQVRLNSQHGGFESDVYLRIQIGGQPAGRDVIFFGASGIPLTQAGGFAGDISLALLAPYTFNLGQDVSITLLGALGNEGAVGTSPTRATINCYGFKELSLSAEIAFSERVLKPAGGGSGKVTTRFQTTVADWNDILVDISIPPFEIPGLNDWVFHVQNAVIDLSETRSSPNVVFPRSYLAEYPTAELRNLWKGVYIRELSVTLPHSFTPGQNSSTIRGSHFLIDRHGFSGTLSASPVFSINQGDAGGWPLSMDNLLLEFDRNRLIRGEFSGELLLPVSDSPLRYTGMLSLPNNYALTVAITDTMNFDLWRLATVRLDANSSISIMYDNSSRQFRSSAVLHGTMGMNIGNLAEVQQIRFSNMRLSTVQPYFQIESLTYDNTISIANFPASISNIEVRSIGTNLSLGFRTTVGLTSTEDNGFGGGMDLAVRSRLEREGGRQRWVYDGFEMSEVAINVSTTAFSLNGRLGVFESDEVFGTGFYGNVNMRIGALSDAFTAEATAIFGRLPEFRYWFADASVTFPTGIPIAPALVIDGFSGGIAQRMSFAGAGFSHRFARSGISYVPDRSTSLLIKAGTMLRSSGRDVFTGNLGLEIAFNQHNGIRHLNFNGSGQIASNMPRNDDLERINRSLNTIASPQAAEAFHQNERRAGVNSGAISVMADLTMNFERREFSGLFEAYVNTPFLRGVGPNGRMGRVDVFFGQNEWFIHAGSPDIPIGLNLGIGPISVNASAYLMAGHNLPPMPPPPPQVTRILGKPIPSNRNTDQLNLGRGFAFGADLGINTGRNTIAIFYSEFSAGIGFDAMLRYMGNTFCVGSSTPVGIRGWYIEGQAYAFLAGEVGLTMRLFGRRRDFSILQGSAAVLLQAKLPNPSWFAGDLALQYSILNGMVRGRARISVEVGRQCVFEHRGGAHALEGQELISEVSPNDPNLETDVFVSPQAVFNMPIREFRMDESSAMIRAELAEFSLNEGGRPIEIRNAEWDTERFMVRINPEDALPGLSQINGRVRLTFSEQNASGNWTPVLAENGRPHEETRDITFRTAERPQTIDMRHVRYAYPVPDQQFFLQREHPIGFIYLHHNFGYLFTEPSTIVRGRFRSGSEIIWVDLAWDNVARRITWNRPELRNSTNYIFEIVSLPLDGTTAGGVQASYAQATFEGMEEGSAEIRTNVAGDAGSDGEFIILSYNFRTSMFNTFAEKMGQITLRNSRTRSIITSGFVRFVFGDMTTQEGFDQADLTGTEQTQHSPLIVVRSTLTSNYHRNTIAPLLYANYPFGGAVRYSREEGQSIIPDWAVVRDWTYRYGTTVFFPWMYYLAYTYFQDFNTARTQIAASATARATFGHILTVPYFPMLPNRSNYEIKFAYTLPNGTITNSSIRKTFIVP